MTPHERLAGIVGRIETLLRSVNVTPITEFASTHRQSVTEKLRDLLTQIDLTRDALDAQWATTQHREWLAKVAAVLNEAVGLAENAPFDEYDWLGCLTPRYDG